MKKKMINSKKRLIAILLTFLILFLYPSQVYSDMKTGVTSGTIGRISDSNTMDDYLNVLNLLSNSSNAGRVWADKSVLTDASLLLDMKTDGIDTLIVNNSDFLHVFSALGSVMFVSEDIPVPLDVMIILDVSSSMNTSNNNERLHYNVNTRKFENTNAKIVHAVQALNEAMQMLMDDNPYNRVGVVAYSGNQITCQLGEEPNLPGSNFWPDMGVLPMGKNPIDLYLEAKEKGEDGLNYLQYLLPFNVKNSVIYPQSGKPSAQLAANGMTLLPLGRYTPSKTYIDQSNDGEPKQINNNDFIDPNTGENYGYFNLGNAYGNFSSGNNWDMTVTAPQVLVTCSSTYDDPNYEAAPVIGMHDNAVLVDGATNTQAGIYTGMSTLAGVHDTIQDINGVKVQRKPLVILITDGAPTSSTMDGDEWWNCPPDGNPIADPNRPAWQRQAVPSGDERSPGVGDNSGNAILAMATASYWKDRINEHYYEKYIEAGGKLNQDTGEGVILNDFSEVKMYTIGVDMAPNMTVDDPSLRADVQRSNEYSNISPEEMLRYVNGGYDGDIVELMMDPSYALLTLEEKQIKWDSDITIRQNWPNRPTTENVFRQEVLDFWETYQNGEAAPIEQGNVYFWMSLALSMGGLPMSIQRIVPSNGLGANGPGTNIKGEVITDPKYKEKLVPEYERNDKGEIIGFTAEFEEKLKDFQENGYMPCYNEPTKLSHPDKDISTLEYSDGFINVDSGNSVRNLESALDSILRMFIDATIPNPINGHNTISKDTKNVLTYKDPIGRYMEIKNIDSFVLFGHRYKLVKDGALVDGKQYYTIDPNSLADTNLEQSKYGYYYNPSYDWKNTVGEDALLPHERVDFYLSDIKIWVENIKHIDSGGVEDGLEGYEGFEQALYVEIPSNALPARTIIIEPVNKSSNDKSYRVNTGDDKSVLADIYGKTQADYYAESTPFRLFYSVGLADNLLDPDADEPTVAKNIVDLIDTDYLNNIDPNTGTLYFYSNWYSTIDDNGNVKEYTYSTGQTYTFGDPVITFSPNSKNSYYVFQKNAWVYEALDNTHLDGGLVLGTEGNWYWSDTNISIGDPLTDKNLIQEDKLYYVVINQYINVNGFASEINVAIPRLGIEFSSSLGDKNDSTMYNDYLYYVNINDSNDVSDTSASGYVVAVKEGGLRSGDLSLSVRSKESLLTGTAETYYLPTIGANSNGVDGSDAKINVYLGNNGRLTIIIPRSSTELILEGTKHFVGGILKDNMFSFSLMDQDKKTIQTVYADNNGHFIFDAIEFTRSDIGKTFTYFIHEIVGNENLIYDTHEEKITVKVTENENSSVCLLVEYDNDGIMFENIAYHTLEVSKNVTGNLGSKTEDFEFTLLLSGDNAPTTILYEKNDEIGELKIQNGIFKFTLKHDETIRFVNIPANVTYTITEENNDYKTTIETSDGIVSSNTITGKMEEDTCIKYINTRDGLVPTEINIYNTQWILLLLIPFVLWFGLKLYYKCKRKFD